MSEDFGIPQDKIKIHIVHVGGDFGAKASLIGADRLLFIEAAGESPFSWNRFTEELSRR